MRGVTTMVARRWTGHCASLQHRRLPSVAVCPEGRLHGRGSHAVTPCSEGPHAFFHALLLLLKYVILFEYSFSFCAGPSTLWLVLPDFRNT